MSYYERCPTCKAFENLERHVCPPAWDAANHAGEIVERLVYGHEAEAAAENYREADTADWEKGDEVFVSVRRKGAAEWQHFIVTREYEPSFSASVLRSPPWGWEEP